MTKMLAVTVALTVFFSGAALAKVERKFYPDGELKSAVVFNKEGKRHGPYKIFWSNGRLKEAGKYNNGKLVKPVRRYDSDGTLIGP